MLPCLCHNCHATFVAREPSRCPACNSDFIEIQLFPASIFEDSEILSAFPHLHEFLDNNISMDRRNYGHGTEFEEIVTRLLNEKESIQPASREYVKSLKIVVDDVNCTICLKKEKECNVVVLQCGHKYHAKCVKGWLKLQNTCPNCRIVLDD